MENEKTYIFFIELEYFCLQTAHYSLHCRGKILLGSRYSRYSSMQTDENFRENIQFTNYHGYYKNLTIFREICGQKLGSF